MDAQTNQSIQSTQSTQANQSTGNNFNRGVQTGLVKAESLFVRSEPDAITGPIVNILGKGDSVKVEKHNDVWSKLISVTKAGTKDTVEIFGFVATQFLTI